MTVARRSPLPLLAALLLTLTACGRQAQTPADPPTVTAVEPQSGPEAGGTAVTITGSDLTGATAVTFGSNPAASFAVVDDTTIAAVTPAGTGTVDVLVTTPAGASPAGDASDFTYLAPSGALQVSVIGLPAGADASVSVTGPGSYGVELTASETLAGLPEGEYAVTAAAVTVDGNTYTPEPASQTVAVSSDATASATVNYSWSSVTDSATDPAGDDFGTAPGPDVTGLAFTRSAEQLIIEITFAEPVTLPAPGSATSGSQLGAYIELDTDRDDATGATSDVTTFCPGTLGPEYRVELFSRRADGGYPVIDSSNVTTGAAIPTIDGSTLTLAIPRAALGDLGGSFDFGMAAGVETEPTDCAPDAPPLSVF